MNAGIVKMAAATSASPTEAAVRAMFCSRIVPRKYGSRKSAIAMTAAGIVAAIVCPAFIPKYALAAPKSSESKRPTTTAFTVISGGAFSGGTFSGGSAGIKEHGRTGSAACLLEKEDECQWVRTHPVCCEPFIGAVL